MKTIEQAAKEYANAGCYFADIRKWAEQSFIQGAKFARQWISAEAELPPMPENDIAGERNADIDEDLPGLLTRVSTASSVTVEMIKSPSRCEKTRIARQMFCYIAQKRGKWTLVQIGEAIGRNHTTVIHSYRVVETMLQIRQAEYVELWRSLQDLE